MSEIAVSERATNLIADSLVWDDHAGFEFSHGLDLDRVWRWKEAGFDYLSVSAGYDVQPWTLTVQAAAAWRRFIDLHPDRYILASSGDDIRRARAEGKLALALDIEGMCSLDEKITMVQLYYDLGVRQMNFAYNLNNAAGGGCHDEDIGLTAFGRDVVVEMNRVGMMVDCSHNAYRTTMEAMEISVDPVIFSHSNSRELCDHERNIWDDQILACAATGGVVGVNGIHWFLDEMNPGIEAFVRHIDYMVQKIGPAHVGLGIDYVFDDDTLFETKEAKGNFWPDSQYGNRPKRGYLPPEIMPETTERLLQLGYGDDDLHAIYGLNFLRMADQVWK
ncbi:MAG: membrane dipeptidase [Alphaproteobacteria bacterium]|jgi:membrane dipeptidase|nr:membrane dipeptidase [Rhodospirillaceae bacterium]MBT7615528.1 membrane dipeptidase [Rhodospirillaceae bacterium]MDG2481243.1 membrane dipeptidase [Alphaproteobacteria bacterium]